MFAAWPSAMLQTLCSAPSRLCAFCCWALAPMSVLVRTRTTVVPRAVAAACAVARGIGSRTLPHTITSAAHAHAPWHGPRLGQEVSGRVKTVSKDCIIFHLCIGLGVWSAASAQRCRGLPLAHHTPRVAYGHHRTARGPLPARSLTHVQEELLHQTPPTLWLFRVFGDASCAGLLREGPRVTQRNM